MPGSELFSNKVFVEPGFSNKRTLIYSTCFKNSRWHNKLSRPRYDLMSRICQAMLGLVVSRLVSNVSYRVEFCLFVCLFFGVVVVVVVLCVCVFFPPCRWGLFQSCYTHTYLGFKSHSWSPKHSTRMWKICCLQWKLNMQPQDITIWAIKSYK